MPVSELMGVLETDYERRIYSVDLKKVSRSERILKRDEYTISLRTAWIEQIFTETDPIY